jgi:cytochrome c5
LLVAANLVSGQTPDAPLSPAILPPSPAPEIELSQVLAWDADAKTFEAKAGELAARFEFYVTNISSEVVVITNLHRSCGCTDATMPAQPWNLAAGESGAIKASIDLRGKGGAFSKLLTVQSSLGSKLLTLNVNIAPPPATGGEARMDRTINQGLAAQDRQVVFKGDCAKCHATPTIGKMGSKLYQAGCAICHDAEHRAPWCPISVT